MEHFLLKAFFWVILFVMSKKIMYHLKFELFLLGLSFSVLTCRAENQKHSLEASTCRLLEHKFAVTNPWTSYPIVYEPITRGRLTIWSAISSLPTSEFECQPSGNGTNEIILNYDNAVNKLEWTFYDLNKGFTYNGVSVNHCSDIKYKISIEGKQSYYDCNKITGIKKLNASSDVEQISLKTSCPECSSTLIQLINGQLEELIKLKLDEQIEENLYWQLSQLLTNQSFNIPLEL